MARISAYAGGHAAIVAFALAFCPGLIAQAQLPPGVFAGARDYHQASAGAYTIDPSHTAVIAKVSHIGYGLSVFRFDTVSGTLAWDPAHPGKSSLTVAVQTNSISTPVPGFAAELAGDGYLKSVIFPTATFVSTGFRQTDDIHGQIDGQFTLMGKTRPVTFDVVLMGAGRGFMGHARIGAEAVAHINPGEYGLNPMFSAPIELEIDAEFEQK